MMAPKTTSSRLPTEPKSLGAQSCKKLLSMVSAVAPTIAPHRLERPPTTAMNRYSMPVFSPNGVALMARCKWA